MDVVDYADRLGAAGIVRFEAHLDKRRQSLTGPFDGRPDPEFSHDDEWHARHAVLHNLQRLAVLRGDEEAIVSTHGGDMPRAHMHAAAAKALREAGLLDRATVIAHEGMTLPRQPAPTAGVRGTLGRLGRRNRHGCRGCGLRGVRTMAHREQRGGVAGGARARLAHRPGARDRSDA